MLLLLLFFIFVIDACYYKPIIFADVVVYRWSFCIIVVFMIVAIDTNDFYDAPTYNIFCYKEKGVFTSVFW